MKGRTGGEGRCRKVEKARWGVGPWASAGRGGEGGIQTAASPTATCSSMPGVGPAAGRYPVPEHYPHHRPLLPATQRHFSVLLEAQHNRPAAHCLLQVWDLQQGVMLYQSAILTASPLTAVAVDPTFPRVAVGASDGTVRFFDLSSLPACRALQVGRGS